VASDRMLGRVIACGTLFLDFEKKIGELSITKDPRYLPEGVGTDITRAIIREAISRGFRVIIHTSVENEAMIRVMEKLGYKPKRMIRCYEKYKDRIKAKNFDAYEWVITARSS
jgi:RimJ/RimL family protein N-acetyltransferase